MRRPIIYGPPVEWKIYVAHEIGKKYKKDRFDHHAVKHKDAGADYSTDEEWSMYDVVCSFAFLDRRGDVSDNEAIQLLEIGWEHLPEKDKLALSPYKIHVKSGPRFDPRFNHLYIGNEEDTTPDDSILLAMRLDIKTWTTELWGWMAAKDLRRQREPTRMWNRRKGEYVLGVPYLKTEPPETLPLTLDLNRRLRVA